MKITNTTNAKAYTLTREERISLQVITNLLDKLELHHFEVVNNDGDCITPCELSEFLLTIYDCDSKLCSGGIEDESEAVDVYIIET